LPDLGETVDRQTGLRVGVGLSRSRPHNVLPLALEHLGLCLEAVDTSEGLVEVGLVLLATGLGVCGVENIVLLRDVSFNFVDNTKAYREPLFKELGH
jgi:hypothetical protein